MCGIAGLASFNDGFLVSEENLKRFSECLKYRGPDHEGYLAKQYNNTYLSFAHRRLKIIDLSDAGNQPMFSTSGRTLINYNGEIFHFSELKKQLLQEGFLFKSNCDTEVILNAYEAWGIEKTLEVINGMFAFVLYDIPGNKFIIARDRFGKKPLYFYRSGNKLAYSSDIRSFHVYPGKLSINYYSLGYYFQELTTPRVHSIFNDIVKAEAAHYYVFSENNFEKKRYWQLDFSHKTPHKISEIVDQTDFYLKEAVKKRLIADVSLGIFLSGGIDSSLVTAMASLNSSKKIKTFSVGFTYKPYNELEFASKVAEKYNTEHHEIVLTPSDFSVIDKLIEEFGEPFADSSMIPTYYVSHFASGLVKTVLSGDGGDELFGGYSTFKDILFLSRILKYKFSSPLFQALSAILPFRRLLLLSKLLEDPLNAKAELLFRQMGFNNEEMSQLFPGQKKMLGVLNQEHLLLLAESWGFCSNDFDQIQYAIIKNRLVNDYLIKVDRASMYSSLEVRLPFLDKDLMTYVSTLSHDQLLHKGELKFITKKLAERYLPMGIIYRQKWGFGIPIGKWFREELKEHAREVILDNRNVFPLINSAFAEKIFEEHQKGVDHSHKLWSLYVFYRWLSLNKIRFNSEANLPTPKPIFINGSTHEKITRVAQVIPTLEIAGAEKVAITLALELNKRPGFKCCIVVFKPINEFQHLSKDLEVIVCPSELQHFILKKDKINLFHLINFIKDWQPDIIHSHLMDSELLTRYFVFPRIKYVSHFHNNYKIFANLSFNKLFNKTHIANRIVKSRLLKNYSQCQNTFIAISNENYDYINENLCHPSNRLIKLFNAVDLTQFCLKPIIPVHKPVRLVNIGRMHKGKNPLFLIRMVQELLTRKIDVHLTLVGDGELLPEIEREISRYNLEAKITLYGLSKQPDKILRENDVYVHPSLSETHPLVILEAMACGLPCVGFDVMGVREIIEHGKNGFLCPVNDADAFCTHLETLINDTQLYQNIYLYIKTFREQYNLDKWVDKVTQIYQNSLLLSPNVDKPQPKRV